jgi:hypothetical protein
VKLDRSALADITRPREMAEAIHSQLGDIALPIPVRDLVLENGVSEIKAHSSANFEGALISRADEHTGVILVREGQLDARTRFTIGHEWGHLYLHWHHEPGAQFECSTKDMTTTHEAGQATRRTMEADANAFSSEILMPRSRFLADLKRMKEPGLEHVVELKVRYGTSALATGRRFIDLFGESMAIVSTKDGVLTMYPVRANGFPFITLGPNQVVHRKCLTATFDGNSDECSGTDAVEPTYWLAEAPSKSTELYEQVLVQRDGYRLTLLSMSAVVEDEDQSEWNPRFAYGR